MTPGSDCGHRFQALSRAGSDCHSLLTPGSDCGHRFRALSRADSDCRNPMTLGFGLQACRQPVPDCHTETPPRPDCDFRFPARRRTVPDCHNQASAHSGCVLRSPARRRADPNRYRMTWRPDPCRRSPALCRTGRSRHTRTPSRSDQRRLNFRTLQTWRDRLILQTAQDRRTLQIWRGRPILRTWQGRRTLQTAWDRRRSCGSAPGRLAPAVLRSGLDPRPLFFCRFPAACVHFCHKPGPLPYGGVQIGRAHV